MTVRVLAGGLDDGGVVGSSPALAGPTSAQLSDTGGDERPGRCAIGAMRPEIHCRAGGELNSRRLTSINVPIDALTCAFGADEETAAALEPIQLPGYTPWSRRSAGEGPLPPRDRRLPSHPGRPEEEAERSVLDAPAAVQAVRRSESRE